MTRLSRKEREVIQRRREILGVAERLFAHKGFFKTSMAEIASESEFSVGSLYQFFPSKEAVYIALLEEKFEEYLALVQRAVAAAHGVLEKLDALITTKVRFFEKHRNFFRIYVTEFGVGECSIKGIPGEKLALLREAYLTVVTGVMEAGIRRRLLKKFDAREMAHLLDGMMNAVIRQWIAGAGDEALTPKAEMVREVFLHGIGQATSERRRSR